MKRILAALGTLVVLALAGCTATPSSVSATTWAWCKTGAQATWQRPGGPLGTDYFVQNDAWNAGHGPQKICANSYHEVQVVSDQKKGNTEIETYPDVSGLYNGTDHAVSGYKTISNSFSESFPSDVIGEAADDIWLNNWNIEIMIWTDTHNENPGSFMAHLGNATIGGQTFHVYRNGPKSEEPNTEYVFKLDHNETSGVTHVLGTIRWLMAHGHVPHSAKLTAVQFGWEIAGTNGPETFNLTNYKLSATR